MSREIRAIPPAPRQTLWSAVAWSRWPLACAGGLAVFFGGTVALLLVLAAGGRAHDDDLIQLEAVSAEARITDVRERGRAFRNAEWVRYIYKFPRPDEPGSSQPGEGQPGADTSDGGRPLEASADRDAQGGKPSAREADASASRLERPMPDYEFSCFAPAGLGEPGDLVPAEFAATAPHLNRLAGGRRYLPFAWINPNVFLGLLVLPGLLCLGFWLQGVNDLRRVLCTGDVSLAEVLAVERVRGVLPLMYRVRYRFRDHHADLRVGKHWVRVRSDLGEYLASVVPPEVGLPPELRPKDAPSGRMAVIHDRRWPQVNRLVHPGDFALPAREREKLAEELARIRAD